jgi:hypothetical protein
LEAVDEPEDKAFQRSTAAEIQSLEENLKMEELKG